MILLFLKFALLVAENMAIHSIWNTLPDGGKR